MKEKLITWDAMQTEDCPAGDKHEGMVLLLGDGEPCTCHKCGSFCRDVPEEIYDDL
jgi:hypothetical protein